MNTLTLKIPEALQTALDTASRRRRLSRAELVRQALERDLSAELHRANPASRWLEQSTGLLDERHLQALGDARVNDLLAKHRKREY